MTALGLLLGGFFVLLAIGAPISVAMGMGAVLAVVLGTDLPLVVVGQRMLVILDSFPSWHCRSSSLPACSWRRAE